MSTGIGHDDDGHIDDKRVAGWVCLITAVVLSGAHIFRPVGAEIIGSFLLAAVGLFAPTVAEKFGRNRSSTTPPGGGQ